MDPRLPVLLAKGSSVPLVQAPETCGTVVVCLQSLEAHISQFASILQGPHIRPVLIALAVLLALLLTILTIKLFRTVFRVVRITRRWCVEGGRQFVFQGGVEIHDDEDALV